MSEGPRARGARLNCAPPHSRRGGPVRTRCYWLEDPVPGQPASPAAARCAAREGEPLVCGIDADVIGDLDTVEDGVDGVPQALGAPRVDGRSLATGAARVRHHRRGVALCLDRHGLPEQVRRERRQQFLGALNDAVDFGLTCCGGVLGGARSRTAVYVCGPSARAIPPTGIVAGSSSLHPPAGPELPPRPQSPDPLRGRPRWRGRSCRRRRRRAGSSKAARRRAGVVGDGSVGGAHPVSSEAATRASGNRRACPSWNRPR